jgi:hypothetical protein
VYPSGSRRCWSLLIGHSSLLVANAFPWGRVRAPAGLAPEALQERECSCRGFFASFYQWAWYLFQPASAMFQSASVTRALLVSFAFGAPQEVQSCVEPPSLGPLEAIGASSPACCKRALAVPPRGGG